MDMIRLFDNGVTIQSGKPVAAIAAQTGAKEKTIAAKNSRRTRSSGAGRTASQHITFVGITISPSRHHRASGLTRFRSPMC